MPNSPGNLSSSPKHAEHTPDSPKKRRKVNHACIYCRRSHMTCDLERPCTRCVKRSIGHLCHDEPRENARPKNEIDAQSGSNGASEKVDTGMRAPVAQTSRDDELPLTNKNMGIPDNLQTAVLPQSLHGEGNTAAQYPDYGGWGVGFQNGALDMQNLYTPYLFNAPDIGSEYNLLSNFLNTSLLEESPDPGNEPGQNTISDQNSAALASSGLPPEKNASDEPRKTTDPNTRALTPAVAAGTISRPRSAKPSIKDEERFYMNIADPSGNDKPEERMKKLLEAKFAAGLLRPFNYIQGYARLNKYLENHMHPSLRQRMMLQIDKFRPKFREKMQSLTDMELTMVEMWFERTLMEYDRVFASLAIPACCWRRTGEIFRGNKAMAELIHVPVDKLRDGQLGLHEIMAERDLVSYWDNFIAIAFDNSQKAMLTSCTLKTLASSTNDGEIKCCFSFTVRRDAQHNIPSLIVGHFLPQLPRAP